MLRGLIQHNNWQSNSMCRYFFHIRDGQTLITDPDGDDLADEAAALGMIQETVADIVNLPHVYGDFARWAARAFVVTDESGRTVLDVPVPQVLASGMAG